MKKVIVTLLLVISFLQGCFAGSTKFTQTDGVAFARRVQFQMNLNSLLTPLSKNSSFDKVILDALFSLEKNDNPDTIWGLLNKERTNESYNGVSDAERVLYNIMVAVRLALATFLTNVRDCYKSTYGVTCLEVGGADPVSKFSDHVQKTYPTLFQKSDAFLSSLSKQALNATEIPTASTEKEPSSHYSADSQGTTEEFPQVRRRRVAKSSTSGDSVYPRVGKATAGAATVLFVAALAVNNASDGEKIELTDKNVVALWGIASCIAGYTATLTYDVACASADGIKFLASRLGCGRNRGFSRKK